MFDVPIPSGSGNLPLVGIAGNAGAGGAVQSGEAQGGVKAPKLIGTNAVAGLML